MKTEAAIRRDKILKIEKQLLFVWMFLCKTTLPEKTNLQDIYDEYCKYVSSYTTTNLIYGKLYFAAIIQEFGAVRKRRHGPSVWFLPQKLDPEDLIYLIKSKTDEIRNG